MQRHRTESELDMPMARQRLVEALEWSADESATLVDAPAAESLPRGLADPARYEETKKVRLWQPAPSNLLGFAVGALATAVLALVGALVLRPGHRAAPVAVVAAPLPVARSLEGSVL